VAKGLNFPLVSVVGAVNADIGLNMPDFRAAERTFDLLCQVAGRAGRGTFAGRAIIQTFAPGQYAIRFAAQHDYVGFYEAEIAYRRSFNYPPFSDMVRLVFGHTNSEKCCSEASRVAGVIGAEIRARGLTGVKVIGPSGGHIARLRGKYQMQIAVLGHDLQDLLGGINLPAGWVLDVDPVGMV
jgi:primosomal protein N' (replication factor Y)